MLRTRLASALGAVLWCLSGTPAGAADLELNLGGEKMRRGKLRVAVFASEDEFKRFAEPQGAVSAEGEVVVGVFARDQDIADLLAKEVPVDAKTRTVKVRFENLAPGEYGAAAFLDTNGNGILDATITRRLLEPWGASNNPPPAERPLRWDEIRFVLPEGGLVLDIRLQ